MNIGITATYCDFEDINLTAADLDKIRRVAENQWGNLSVEKLLPMIYQRHLDTFFKLHWLRALTNSIPELSKWQGHVSVSLCEKAAKLQLPAKPTRVHPLPCSGKNETITTEFKDALFDFFSQMGQHNKQYNQWLTIAGGDGWADISEDARASTLPSVSPRKFSKPPDPQTCTFTVAYRVDRPQLCLWNSLGFMCSAWTLQHLDIALPKSTDQPHRPSRT